LLLLLFAAVVVAVPLRAGAAFLERHTPISARPGLLLVVAAVTMSLGAFGYLFGTRVQSELGELFSRLPELADQAQDQWDIPDLGPETQEYLSSLAMNNGLLGNIAGYTTGLVGVLGGTILIIVSGVFLAANPGTYRRGLLALVPQQMRDEAATALDASGDALRRWLLGQLIAMAVVGVATGAGLYLIGIESALALGLIAGLLEFIPFIGPILAAVPAVLIALGSGDYTVFYVIGLYLLIQQLENNLLVPIIQRRTADSPPVLGIFAVIGMGMAFGPLGLLFGTPLTVVLVVLVKYLYVRKSLDEQTSIPAIDDVRD
jgi:predicted PurR-regulated permease PerM